MGYVVDALALSLSVPATTASATVVTSAGTTTSLTSSMSSTSRTVATTRTGVFVTLPLEYQYYAISSNLPQFYLLWLVCFAFLSKYI